MASGAMCLHEHAGKIMFFRHRMILVDKFELCDLVLYYRFSRVVCKPNFNRTTICHDVLIEPFALVCTRDLSSKMQTDIDEFLLELLDKGNYICMGIESPRFGERIKKRNSWMTNKTLLKIAMRLFPHQLYGDMVTT
ncbi:uncharacterized protein LOC116924459 [Daphnia magna]|uniref:uncharacterized protein LOC116924459 n=1 Tax=Daphnia magna TaxID=35525 RepID=UPI001E1BA033|nr:uncharacterized protein LOC116924459 [Daphnia magna]XP_045030859.1 uncharacterized protein LOC116924459 [Daphnia magna]XP_045030860.1 uncharacterized protein LOC116924459 [Daphnia magna]